MLSHVCFPAWAEQDRETRDFIEGKKCQALWRFCFFQLAVLKTSLLLCLTWQGTRAEYTQLFCHLQYFSKALREVLRCLITKMSLMYSFPDFFFLPLFVTRLHSTLSYIVQSCIHVLCFIQLFQGLPVDCRQGCDGLNSFHLPCSMCISVSLIQWLDAFSLGQSLTCAKLSRKKHTFHFLPGFSFRAYKHPKITLGEAYRHGRTGKTRESRIYRIKL